MSLCQYHHYALKSLMSLMSLVCSDDYSNPASEPGQASAAKKARVSITEEQREALNIAFFLDPYPGTQAVEYLAQELGLEVRTINTWFHNHRYEMSSSESCV